MDNSVKEELKESAVKLEKEDEEILDIIGQAL